jgi:hypothetical protein
MEIREDKRIHKYLCVSLYIQVKHCMPGYAMLRHSIGLDEDIVIDEMIEAYPMPSNHVNASHDASDVTNNEKTDSRQHRAPTR